MGRMSSLHSPQSGLTQGVSVVPASRNGGAANTHVNGTTIDLSGYRGAYFQLTTGAMTGAANVASYLQTNDLPADPTNGNWTNVNTTTYANAAVTAKTTQSTSFEMSFVPYAGGPRVVRAVLIPEANISLAAVTHIVY